MMIRLLLRNRPAVDRTTTSGHCRPAMDSALVAATRTLAGSAARRGSGVLVLARPAPLVLAYASSAASATSATWTSQHGSNRSSSVLVCQQQHRPRHCWDDRWNSRRCFSSTGSGSSSSSSSSLNREDSTATSTSTIGSTSAEGDTSTTSAQSTSKEDPKEQDGSSSSANTADTTASTNSSNSIVADPDHPIDSEQQQQQAGEEPIQGEWYLAGKSILRDKIDDDDDTTPADQKQAKLNQRVEDPSKFTVQVPVRMPDMDEQDHQSRLVKWYKKVGDVVQYGDILCDIETEDFTFGMETEDECLGIMGEILVSEDSPPIHCGQIICVLLHEPPDESKKKKKKQQPDGIAEAEVLENVKKEGEPKL